MVELSNTSRTQVADVKSQSREDSVNRLLCVAAKAGRVSLFEQGLDAYEQIISNDPSKAKQFVQEVVPAIFQQIRIRLARNHFTESGERINDSHILEKSWERLQGVERTLVQLGKFSFYLQNSGRQKIPIELEHELLALTLTNPTPSRELTAARTDLSQRFVLSQAFQKRDQQVIEQVAAELKKLGVKELLDDPANSRKGISSERIIKLVTDLYGLPLLSSKVAPLESGTAIASFSAKDWTITINQNNGWSNNLGHNSAVLLHTLLHETRHAFQWKLTYGYLYNLGGYALPDSLGDNAGFPPAFRAYQDDIRAVALCDQSGDHASGGYYTAFVERDARAFTDKVFEALDLSFDFGTAIGKALQSNAPKSLWGNPFGDYTDTKRELRDGQLALSEQVTSAISHQARVISPSDVDLADRLDDLLSRVRNSTLFELGEFHLRGTVKALSELGEGLGDDPEAREKISQAQEAIKTKLGPDRNELTELAEVDFPRLSTPERSAASSPGRTLSDFGRDIDSFIEDRSNNLEDLLSVLGQANQVVEEGFCGRVHIQFLRKQLTKLTGAVKAQKIEASTEQREAITNAVAGLRKKLSRAS